jgi:ATP synthase protein I
MSDEPTTPSLSKDESGFIREVSSKAARKLKFQKDGPKGVWFGLGMAGIIGWSVTVPTVAGGMLGLWWDHRHPGTHSWTLMLLAIGLVVGCANAWRWVTEQDAAMRDEPEDKDA